MHPEPTKLRPATKADTSMAQDDILRG